MKVARSVAEVLSRHTTLTLECVDRMYLNVYVPLLQAGAGVAHFLRKMHGRPVPSSALMAPMTQRFVEAIKRYAERNRIDIVSFRRGERKDERTREYLRTWTGGEGVLYIGRAQEKACCGPNAATTPPPAPPIRGWQPRLRWSTSTTCGSFPQNAILLIHKGLYPRAPPRRCVLAGVSFGQRLPPAFG